MVFVLAKASKGKVLWTIAMTTLTLGQVIVLGFGLSFVRRVEEAELTYLKQQARKNLEWTIDESVFRQNEKIIPKQFFANSSRSVYGFYHSQDQDLILTIKSSALKRLFNENYLVVTESRVDEHLLLTLYYNPLRDKEAAVEDMIQMHQVVRYQKPELVQLYEREKALESEKKGTRETDKEKEAVLSQSERLQFCLNVPSFEPLYPFDSTQIVKETDEFIVYQTTANELDEDILNINFYRLYLGEDSIHGKYGWDKELFFPSMNEIASSEEDESSN